MSKANFLVGVGALVTFFGWANMILADQPAPPPNAPAVAVPPNAMPPAVNALPPAANPPAPGSNTQPPATQTAVPAAHHPLRDKLFHGPLFSHPKGLCHGPCTTDDPDMGCGTCHSEWVFLFGSCCAFFNEPFYYSPWR
jgi:hypothetical protein